MEWSTDASPTLLFVAVRNCSEHSGPVYSSLVAVDGEERSQTLRICFKILLLRYVNVEQRECEVLPDFSLNKIYLITGVFWKDREEMIWVRVYFLLLSQSPTKSCKN